MKAYFRESSGAPRLFLWGPTGLLTGGPAAQSDTD